MNDPPTSSRSAASHLPAEILADIIELAILTSSPCPRRAPAFISNNDEGGAPVSPFATPLRATYTSAWSWTGQLLYVSKFFHSIARPLLLRTLTLDSPRAARSFLSTADLEEDSGEGIWGKVDRAWLGNISALAREDGQGLDPVSLRLNEAAWYEECSGGFVVGHAYASRVKVKRKKGKAREKQYRSVSVYWAEEQLVEEVSNSGRSSSDDDDDEDDADAAAEHHTPEADGFARSSPSHHNAQWEVDGSSRRASHQEGAGTAIGEARLDHPHEAAWQTLYSRRRRSSPIRTRTQPSSSAANGVLSISAGPSEGDLDPWDMQDAQERLAALSNTPSSPPPDASHTSDPAPAETSDPIASPPPASRRPHTEIYAYHLCTATLEPFINPLFASIRTLRLITLTFYPGHLLDDDKLEHMLRRILSPECPRLETLLLRIVFDAASAGSRMRRFERTKTIAGAVDRIGDERVRVMLVNNRVGEGELVAGEPGGGGSALSRKAITLTKEGWWARVLQCNHHQKHKVGPIEDGRMTASDDTVKRERMLSDWTMFFPPDQHANPTHLVNLVQHCDPWPDCPTPVA